MKTFCEIIRELREDRDLKQADVAKVLGTSQQYYSKYETGKYEMPIHCITALADFYGVSTDYILGRSEFSIRPNDYKKPLVGNYTADAMLADMLSLDVNGRKAVRDYIALQKKANQT
ncbi:MAG: hypothetical protein BHW36_12120 [Firmicutes bacterium CAG:24053_14]|nr:MAG: hypothetical protein BHW36_12120 [Firmicutes bacterium CAG:24053_14]